MQTTWEMKSIDIAGARIAADTTRNDDDLTIESEMFLNV